MEEALGVTDSGVCADVVDKLRSEISVTEPPCYNSSGHNKKETIVGDDFVGYHDDSDSGSESEWTGEPEENVSSCQDNAHCQCQKQVNKSLHVEDGGDKSWRLYNPFNFWREKLRNATAETENPGNVIDCKRSNSSGNVLDIACSNNSNIESAFSECSVSHTNNVSSLSNQGVYHSECNIDVSDGKSSKDVKTVEEPKKPSDQLTSNNFRSFVLEPITSLLHFSFRRVYPCGLPAIKSLNFQNMGNLQGSEGKGKGGGTGKSPGKGKKDKSGKKSPARELLKHKPPAPQPPSKSNSHV